MFHIQKEVVYLPYQNKTNNQNDMKTFLKNFLQKVDYQITFALIMAVGFLIRIAIALFFNI